MPVQRVKALYEFWGENDAELSFQVGDVLIVLNQDHSGWWEGELNGRKGLFPSNYVEPIASVTATNASAPRVAAIAARLGPPVIPAITAPPSPQTRLDNPILLPPPPPMMLAGSLEPKEIASPSAARIGGHGATVVGYTVAPASSPPPPTSSVSNEKLADARTKFGPWSSNMALYAGLNMITFGLLGFLWFAEGEAAHILSRDLTLYASLYSFIIGFLVLGWEHWWGRRRTMSRIPLRGIIYTLFSIFLFCSWPTMLPAFFLLATGLTNFAATAMGEVYEAPAPQTVAAASKDAVRDAIDAVQIYLASISKQGRVGEFTFYLLYAAGNVVLFAVTLQIWLDKVAVAKATYSDNKELVPTGWTPLAKGFGAVLDLNCAVIFLPVCRTLLRSLYNRSTADQGFISTALRGVLFFIPLDQNLKFHKLVAKVIMGATIAHTVTHYINFAMRPVAVLNSFNGSWALISGGLVCLIMFFIYTAAFESVKRGQFEIFWYSHHAFILFFIVLMTHGRNGLNPGYWRYIIAPGALYLGERLLRLYRAHQPVIVRSVTIMDDVFSLELDKVGVFSEPYQEGQYIFLNAPAISYTEWHPFTISSAPEEKTVTVHIRVSREGSWTKELCKYMALMGPPGKSWFALGKARGPDGKPLLCIDGPHSAPTQHMSEYSTAAIIGAGIGATPVAATLSSIVFHRWKYFIGRCYPDHAFFMWVCAHRDIDAFRWLIRNIKDAQDEVMHMRANNASHMASKTFEFHIWVTSVSKNNAPSAAVVIEDDIGFWGVPREKGKIAKVHADWDEADLYRTMKAPTKHTVLGDVHVYEGRPQWQDRFADISARHPTETIGVAFCGNPMIAKDLKKQCYAQNQKREDGFFKLHKENF